MLLVAQHRFVSTLKIEVRALIAAPLFSLGGVEGVIQMQCSFKKCCCQDQDWVLKYYRSNSLPKNLLREKIKGQLSSHSSSLCLYLCLHLSFPPCGRTSCRLVPVALLIAVWGGLVTFKWLLALGSGGEEPESRIIIFLCISNSFLHSLAFEWSEAGWVYQGGDIYKCWL